MKHKFWLILLTCMSALCLALGISACGRTNGGNGHSHVLTEHEEIEPTCTTEGTNRYWHCSVCELNFADEDGKTQLEELSIPALGHDMTKHEAKEATETEDGNNEYWECGRCEQFFSDAKGEHPIEDKSSVVIPTKNHVHEPIRHEAKEATCTEDGNELYFECVKCHTLFLDESCTERTTLADVQKQTTGHQAKSEWEQGEDTHYHVCEVCSEKMTDTETPHDFGTTWESDENGHWQTCTVCGKKGNESAHDFGAGNVCATCNYMQYSVGLKYQLNEDQASYSVVGIGSCEDKDLVIPSTHETLPVTSIGDRAFIGKSGLTSIKIPDSVTSIGMVAFRDCSGLTSVTIGNGVTSIDDEAFRDCSGLTSVTIGNGVTSIGRQAFSGCNGLKEVHITNLAAWFEITFSDYLANPLRYAHHLYLNEEEIKDLTIPAEITEIKAFAFYGCDGLTSITIGNGVTSISQQAFYDCSGLTGELKIPDGVTSIGQGAFYHCSGLTGELKIPDSVNSIGLEAFLDCSGLTSMTIGDKVTKIEEWAFYGCSGLASVTLGRSVTSIGLQAFYHCSGLTSMTIGDKVTKIEEWAFYGCSGLETVYYKGTADGWGNIHIADNNSNLTSATLYYFTEDKPTAEEWASHDYWWHYDPDTSLPTPWVKENQ